MILISHRGNTDGSFPQLENRPEYVRNAVDLGYEVEVDVWFVNGGFYLGHDFPQYAIHQDWFSNLPLWCHAKNKEALVRLLSLGIHCFWHETDRFTLTSRGIPWCYPDNYIDGGITVMKNNLKYTIEGSLGVCTDYPKLWRET
jgi:hypothetical protein